MLYIQNTGNDPYFNLAAEEYLLTRKQEDIFLLWVNSDVIVVGRNQNTMAEINYDYVTEQNIAVVRRLTGGGAVFHDKGNLNFTFIESHREALNFSHFGHIIIGALQKLGLDAQLSGRNDLTLEGKKFSGHAATVYQGRHLHHGTLMLNLMVDTLGKALKTDPQKIESKGVKSVRSRVTNINSHLAEPISVPRLIEVISQHIGETYPDMTPYTFTPENIAAIGQLADEKYRTWEWCFGGSPKYSFSKKGRYAGGSVEVRLAVEKGIIEEARIYGDFFGTKEVSELTEALTGLRHDKEAITKKLSGTDWNQYFFGACEGDILPLFW